MTTLPPPCPACQSSAVELTGSKNNCTIHHCTSCGTYYASECDPAAVAALYQEYARTQNYSGKSDKKMRRSRRRLAMLRKRFGGKTFLDYGCNLGYAVEAAREQGYEALGFDIDAPTVERARVLFPDCHFRYDNLVALEGKIDLLYCAEVIEHVPDTRAFAAQLARLLSPGGVLFLTTPDGGHWLRTRNFLNWNMVIPPEHLVWLNRRSIRLVLENAGLSDVRFRLNLKPGLRVFARKAA